MRMTGGANFPAVAGRFDGGRLNATWPFGVLTVGSGRVHLRARLIGAVWRMSGAEPLDGTPEEIAEVFPCRGRLGTAGVGLRTVQGHRYYFWTGAVATVIDTCRHQGFTVSSEVQTM
ncbi:hypothetical protein [Kitasatospora sp. NPDC085464]|uniref:hypothetical protein n=1 Tax=Kitasatospora sp. NPDC085464 TaxID=3364063 RepID=UPI0037C89C91